MLAKTEELLNYSIGFTDQEGHAVMLFRRELWCRRDQAENFRADGTCGRVRSQICSFQSFTLYPMSRTFSPYSSVFGSVEALEILGALRAE